MNYTISNGSRFAFLSLFKIVRATLPVAMIFALTSIVGYFQSASSASTAELPRYFDENPLKRAHIYSFAKDQNGALWIGAEESGVVCYDPKVTAPGKPWAQYKIEQGLADNNAYSLAIDRRGFLWVGSLNHGVTVFNGKQWKNYGQINGPLGERVFALACCPTDGDMWIGTNAGLTRYSVSKDKWYYYNRTDGLPSDQISAIAFDKFGNIFVGTQCDGIAKAEAADNYFSWKLSQCSYGLHLELEGQGLQTNLINTIFVADDQTIYAGTSSGIAISKNGTAWSFLRGGDYAEKVKKSANGAPKDWKQASSDVMARLLPEDYVTGISQEGSGPVWLSFRRKGIAALSPSTHEIIYRDPKAGDAIRSIFCYLNNQICLGGIDTGFWLLPVPDDRRAYL